MEKYLSWYNLLFSLAGSEDDAKASRIESATFPSESLRT